MLIHFIVPWPWVKMAVGNRHVFSDIGADPIGNISLIHWVQIDIILSGAWEVNVVVFDDRF